MFLDFSTVGKIKARVNERLKKVWAANDWDSEPQEVSAGQVRLVLEEAAKVLLEET